MLKVRELVAQTVAATDAPPFWTPFGLGECLLGQTMTWGCQASSAIFSALRRAQLEYQNHAHSYRDFRVGAAACVLLRGEDGSMREAFMGGVNVKTHPKDTDDIHAESMVLNRIREFDGKVIGVPLLALVGDSQPNQQTELVTKTLHPCGKCRDMLSDNRELFGGTVILTATPTLDVCQIFDLNLLKSYYAREISEPEPYQLDVSLQLAVLSLGDRLAEARLT